MSLSNQDVTASNHYVYTQKKEDRIANVLCEAFSEFKPNAFIYIDFLRNSVDESVLMSPVDDLTHTEVLFDNELEDARFNLSLIMTDDDRSQIERLTGLTPNLMVFDEVEPSSMHEIFMHSNYSDMITQRVHSNAFLMRYVNAWVSMAESKAESPTRKERVNERERLGVDALWANLISLVEDRGEFLSFDELSKYLTLAGFAQAAVQFKSKAMMRLVSSVKGELPLSLGEKAVQSEMARIRFNCVVRPAVTMLKIHIGLFQSVSRLANGINVNQSLLKSSAQRLKVQLERKIENASYNKCLQALSVGLFGCSYEEAQVVHLSFINEKDTKLLLSTALKQAKKLSCYDELLGVKPIIDDGIVAKARMNERLIRYAAIFLRHQEDWSQMHMGRSPRLSEALCQYLAYNRDKQRLVLGYKNVLKAHTVDEIMRVVEDCNIPQQGKGALVEFVDSIRTRTSDGSHNEETIFLTREILGIHLAIGRKYLRFLSLYSKLMK